MVNFYTGSDDCYLAQINSNHLHKICCTFADCSLSAAVCSSSAIVFLVNYYKHIYNKKSYHYHLPLANQPVINNLFNKNLKDLKGNLWRLMERNFYRFDTGPYNKPILPKY